ncbi:hypothetical protein BS78_K086800 [Paspalum vaginatum]|uniref:Uncharacterized protein n=1 Tax=Paspalum vaginatum TaxID=158149 RepID=A0A9W7X880_9POAL|nr:hypothetical protein BS78_K086800 [Paspalum vaginatum]
MQCRRARRRAGHDGSGPSPLAAANPAAAASADGRRGRRGGGEAARPPASQIPPPTATHPSGCTTSPTGAQPYAAPPSVPLPHPLTTAPPPCRTYAPPPAATSPVRRDAPPTLAVMLAHSSLPSPSCRLWWHATESGADMGCVPGLVATVSSGAVRGQAVGWHGAAAPTRQACGLGWPSSRSSPLVILTRQPHLKL